MLGEIREWIIPDPKAGMAGEAVFWEAKPRESRYNIAVLI